MSGEPVEAAEAAGEPVGGAEATVGGALEGGGAGGLPLGGGQDIFLSLLVAE